MTTSSKTPTKVVIRFVAAKPISIVQKVWPTLHFTALMQETLAPTFAITRMSLLEQIQFPPTSICVMENPRVITPFSVILPKMKLSLTATIK